jgi:hypothetical protein
MELPEGPLPSSSSPPFQLPLDPEPSPRLTKEQIKQKNADEMSFVRKQMFSFGLAVYTALGSDDPSLARNYGRQLRQLRDQHMGFQFYATSPSTGFLLALNILMPGEWPRSDAELCTKFLETLDKDDKLALAIVKGPEADVVRELQSRARRVLQRW